MYSKKRIFLKGQGTFPERAFSSLEICVLNAAESGSKFYFS